MAAPPPHSPLTSYSPSSSSFRVDFETQGTGSALCGEQQIKINRTFPTNLQSLPDFSTHNWEEFCNRIDSVLESLASLRKRNSRISCGILALSAFLLAITPVITRIWLGDLLGNFWYVAMFAVFTVPLFGSCYLVNSANMRDQQIMQDLYNICREMTERNIMGGGAKFYLRRERVYRNDAKSVGIVKYIEVVVVVVLQDNHNGGERNNHHHNQYYTRPARPRTPDTVVSLEEVASSSLDASSGHGTLQQLEQHHRPGPGSASGSGFVSTFDRLRILGSGRQNNVDPSHQV